MTAPTQERCEICARTEAEHDGSFLSVRGAPSTHILFSVDRRAPAPTQLPEGRCFCDHLRGPHVDAGAGVWHCVICTDEGHADSVHDFEEPEGAAEGPVEGTEGRCGHCKQVREHFAHAFQSARPDAHDFVDADFEPPTVDLRGVPAAGTADSVRAEVLKQFNDESWEGVTDTKWCVGMPRELRLDILRWASRVVQEREALVQRRVSEAVEPKVVLLGKAWGIIATADSQRSQYWRRSVELWRVAWHGDGGR